MRVIPNWRAVLRYAWSVKLIILAGILSAAEVLIPFFPELMPWLPPRVLAAAAFVVSLAASFSRFIPHKKVSDP